MQPTYLPWVGYFDLMDQVDKYVFYDDVQLVKQDWHVRNRIKTGRGELYLTVPIKATKSWKETLLFNALINDKENWRQKHLKSIEHAYARSPYYKEVISFVESILFTSITILSEFTIAIITAIAKKIKIETTFLKSSELKSKEGVKDERLVSICKEIDCENYLSPQGSAVYIERVKPGGLFPENNINLFYNNYQHPIYPQLYGEFLPYMCILDLLFNCGFDNALTIIRSGRKNPFTYLEYRQNVLERINH